MLVTRSDVHALLKFGAVHERLSYRKDALGVLDWEIRVRGITQEAADDILQFALKYPSCYGLVLHAAPYASRELQEDLRSALVGWAQWENFFQLMGVLDVPPRREEILRLGQIFRRAAMRFTPERFETLMAKVQSVPDIAELDIARLKKQITVY